MNVIFVVCASEVNFERIYFSELLYLAVGCPAVLLIDFLVDSCVEESQWLVLQVRESSLELNVYHLIVSYDLMNNVFHCIPNIFFGWKFCF